MVNGNNRGCVLRQLIEDQVRKVFERIETVRLVIGSSTVGIGGNLVNCCMDLLLEALSGPTILRAVPEKSSSAPE
jgi:hypothetical protein